MDIYQVGGAVRDGLLGAEIKDRDWVVVGANSDALTALGYRQVGADFPVFLHPETHEEYALARTERKSGQGYKGFTTDSSESVTLEQDLSRRDFTVNAIARAADGTLVDPFNGQRDLERGVLRHISAAFSEDPLRVLRGARFAARFNFCIAPETLELMAAVTRSGELTTLAPERVWQELRRALGETYPQRFITVLRECGALEILFPELEALFGVPQPAKYHPEIDTGEHILLALAQAVQLSANERVRFAVLLHDLGKGATPKDILPSHRGHEDSGQALIDGVCKRLRVPREHRELALLVCKLHTRVHHALGMPASTVIEFLESADAYRRPQRFEDFLAACIIDATGRKGLSAQGYPQAERLRSAHRDTAEVDVQQLRDDGLEGMELAAGIHMARIEKLIRSDS